MADRAEAVHIAVADARPVHELDAELEGAARLAHELRFVYFENLVEQLEVRHRGFAHADGADLLGFDQPDRDVRAQNLGQRGGGHPACGAAADDHDAANAVVVHFRNPAKKPAGSKLADEPAVSHLKPCRSFARTGYHLTPTENFKVRGTPVMLPWVLYSIGK